MRSPLVSCVIPSYNYARFLPDAIESIISQTYANWELIVVDNGSTDNSPEIARRYANQNPDRIRLIELPENTVLANTVGYNAARGEYYAWLAADDVCRPNRFAEGIEFLENHPDVVAVFSMAGVIDAEGNLNSDATSKAIFNIPVESVRQRLLEGNFLCFPSCLIRRDAFIASGGFNPQYRKIGDFEMWLRLLDLGEIERVSSTWVNYRVHGANDVNAVDDEDAFRMRLLQIQAIVEALIRWPLDKSMPAREGEIGKPGETARLLRLARLCLSLDQKYFGRPLVGYHAAHDFVHRAALLEPEHPEIGGLLESVRHDIYAKECSIAVEAPPAAPQAAATSDTEHAIENEARTRQNAYSDWLIGALPSAARRALMREEMGRWTDTYTVEVFVTCLPEQVRELENTLFSLKSQIYPVWKLTVVAFEAVALSAETTGLIPSGQVRVLVLGDDDDSYDVTRDLTLNTAADWICQLWPGDQLAPNAFFELLRTARAASEARHLLTCDEDCIRHSNGRRDWPLFKPAFNRDLLLSHNYLGQFSLVSATALRAIGGYRPTGEGMEEYGVALDIVKTFGPGAYAHVQQVLYSRHETGRRSLLSVEERWNKLRSLLQDHLAGSGATVSRGPVFPLCQIEYPLVERPMVSLVVRPTSDLATLTDCVRAVLAASYSNIQIIVVVTPNVNQEFARWAADATILAGQHGPFERIVRHPLAPGNLVASLNEAAANALGEFLVFIDPTIRPTDNDWIDQLVRNGLRNDIGIVAPRILSDQRTIMSDGLLLGIGNLPAAAPNFGKDASAPGYLLRSLASQNCTAVSGDCFLVRKSDFVAVGGFQADELPALQSVDLCLRIRLVGKQIHLAAKASVIQQKVDPLLNPRSPTSVKKLDRDPHSVRFCRRWADTIADDPNYNRNLSIDGEPYSFESNPMLRHDLEWKPRPRVCAFPRDHWGCGEYRIKAPIRQLVKRGQVDSVWSEVMLGPSDFLKARADAFLFQRHDTLPHLQHITRCKAYVNAFRVYEIDDFYHGASKDRRDNRFPRWRADVPDPQRDEVLSGFEKGARLCDRLVVSSQALAEEYAHFNDDVVVVGNYIEREKWGVLKPRRRGKGKPRVGWAGGNSHFGDLLLLQDAVKVLADEVDWVFFGICPEPLLPWISEYHPGVPVEGYPVKLASLDLDLAVAPLELCRFNECKTPLRLLEYGALGYPVICTDISTFGGAFPVTRVSNSTDDWISAIRAKISNRDALAAEGDLLRNHIFDHWSLEDNLDAWVKAWLPG